MFNPLELASGGGDLGIAVGGSGRADDQGEGEAGEAVEGYGQWGSRRAVFWVNPLLLLIANGNVGLELSLPIGIPMALRERLCNYLDTTDSLGDGFVTGRSPP